MALNLIKALFKKDDARATLRPLYGMATALARTPDWYLAGAVPDTIDGRFDMVAAVTSLMIIRLEAEGDAGKDPGVLLTECFIDDMEGQLRQDGAGDVGVGKHMGHMVSMLGGRLTAYRNALTGTESLEGALVRNLYRGTPPGGDAVHFVAQGLRQLHDRFAAIPLDDFVAGRGIQ